MKDVIIRNANGQQVNTKLVRYFRLNSFEYLIFSLNEIDEGGYVKLYVSKIVAGIGQTIDDDVEWNMIKDTIKTIIKSNKEGQPLPITDLTSDRIFNLQVVNQKIFKLNDSLLQLLSANQKEEKVDLLNNVEDSKEDVINDEHIDTIKPDFDIVNHPVSIQPVEISYNELPQQQSKILEQGSNTSVFETPNNLNVFNQRPVEDTIDYKSLYNEELIKNQTLINEVEKYKNIIDNLKNVLSQNL